MTLTMNIRYTTDDVIYVHRYFIVTFTHNFFIATCFEGINVNLLVENFKS